MAKYCIKCGGKIEEDSVFCIHCGTRVVKEIDTGQQGAVSVQNKPAGRKKQNTASEKESKPEKKDTVGKKKSGQPVPVKLLLIVLAAAIGFTGFVWPGFFRKNKPVETEGNTPPPIVNPVKPDQNGEIPEYSGNSKAFAYEACEGVFVSAEENVFKQDTELKVTELEDIPEKYLDTIQELDEMDLCVVRAFDFDAGLEGNEVMPGTYEVQMDLDVLGIDEEYRPYLSVVRIDDEGYYYEYALKREGSKITYNSSQNSVVVVLIGGALVLYEGGKVIDWGSKSWYFWTKKSYLKLDVESKEYETPYGSYEIQWITSDVDPEVGQKIARVKEIETECRAKAKEYRKTLKGNIFKVNNDYLGYYKKLLAENEEYQTLKRQIKMPDIVLETKKYIDIAYDYLGREARVRMPTIKVLFLIRTDGNSKENSGKLGTAEKLNYTSIVSLWPHKIADQTDKDNYLLTITHELFHICQERYRLSPPVINVLTDDPRFDEMVTMILERDAKEYYIDHKIITTDPPLTEKKYWTDLRLPCDSEPKGLSSVEGKTMKMHEGYQLGDFIMYLQEQYTDKFVYPDKLMRARSYWTGTTISDPVRYAFDITEEEYDLYFRKWLISKRKLFISEAVSLFLEGSYKRSDAVVIQPGKKYHVNMQDDDSYFMAFNQFRKKKNDQTKMMGIIMVDKNFRETHPSVNILPLLDSYVTLENGGILIENLQMPVICEIYGKRIKGEDNTVGYTLYTLDKTPRVTAEETKDEIKVYLPKVTNAAKDGVIDGYRMIVKGNNEVLYEYYIEKKNFEHTLSLSKENLFRNLTDLDTLRLDIIICEYVKDKDGELHYGFESDPCAVPINGSSVGKKTFTGLKVMYDSLCTYASNEFESVDNWSYERDEQPGGNSVTVTGDVVKISLSEIEWEANGTQITGNGTFHAERHRSSVELTGIVIQDYGDVVTYQVTSASESIGAAHSNTVTSYDPRVEEITTVNDVYEESLSGIDEARSTIKLHYDTDGNLYSADIVIFGTKKTVRTQWTDDSPATEQTSERESSITVNLVSE